MHVIGTAGHVDHGKSTLVTALTGIDPDRLKEEKAREMTIDLGFAWLQLPDGEEVSVIDVPGHERFVKNMLAGVGGIDLAMLIVAGDEGVMPQTREHLAILDLLHVKKGVVVVTKRDLVDADFLELVSADIEEVLQGTALEGSPLVHVSSMTGEGLDDLKQLLVRLLQETPVRKDVGTPRLPVDRVFVMPGFGVVVTGTLIDGSLQVGQEVEIAPKGLRARVRGLQSHRKKLNVAGPGRRLAVNLSGVGQEELERGTVVTSPKALTASDAMDARLQMVRGISAVLKHNASVTFHTGTFESPARVRLLDAQELEAGAVGWGQIKTQWRTPILKGDPFILRDSRGTLAGGEIVEPRAKRHRRFHAPLLERLERLGGGTPEEVILEALAAREPVQARFLPAASSLSWEEAAAALARLVDSGQALVLDGGGLQQQSMLYSRRGFEALAARLEGTLAEFHGRSPLRRGMAKEEVRSRLNVQPQAFTLIVEKLIASGNIVEEGPLLRLSSHQVALDETAQRLADQYVASLAANPYSPPSDIRLDPELFNHLLAERRIVKAAQDVVFTDEAYREMVRRVTGVIEEKGAITVAEVRDLFGTSRKYVLALLEYMDQQRITRRVGDERVLR